MGRTLVALLILSGIFMAQSMAENSEKLETKSIADPPSDQSMTLSKGGEYNDDQSLAAEAPAVSRKLSKHHSGDKSVAGGGVIIGGLITAIFAAVYCYIRITRRQSSDHGDKH